MILHTFSDGGARGNPGPAAIGVVLGDEKHHVIQEAAECIGHATNNVAEYRAMILALTLAKARKARHLVCHADSELLIFQLQGIYRIKDQRLQGLAQKVMTAASGFDTVTWKQVPREHPMIARADKLLNQALNREKAVAPLKSQKPSQEELF